jgi:hypothetical protein
MIPEQRVFQNQRLILHDSMLKIDGNSIGNSMLINGFRLNKKIDNVYMLLMNTVVFFFT